MSAQFKLSLIASKRPPNGRCKYNWAKLKDPLTQKQFNLVFKNRFSELIDQQPEASDNEIQKLTNALDTALCQTSETTLRKQPKAKHAHWVTASTLAILDDCNKVGKKYKRIRQQAHKDEWHRLQTRVSKAFDNDQQIYLENQLESLKQADQRREHGTTWQIIR